jgi:hypothetical protein
VPFERGARLGPYEIVAPLRGSGHAAVESPSTPIVVSINWMKPLK